MAALDQVARHVGRHARQADLDRHVRTEACIVARTDAYGHMNRCLVGNPDPLRPGMMAHRPMKQAA